MKKKKILILGGSGLLGSFLCNELEKNYFIKSTKLKEKISKHIKLDASNLKNLFKLVKRYKPHVIINCVALTDVDRCESDKDSAIKLNVEIVANLIFILKKFKNIHLIQISTDQVYNNKKIKVRNLENNVNPINYYGLTKLVGEKVATKHKKTIILRTNFFGNSITSKKSYTDFLIESLKKKLIIKVAKNIYFNPISMKYLSRAINTIIEKKICGTYNIGSKDIISKYNFVKKIAIAYNLSSKNVLKFNSIFKKHNRPLGMTMSINKIQSVIDFKIPTLDKMFNEMQNEQ